MHQMTDYNKGLIYTDVSGCIDCNKCIHECPILKSNVSVMCDDGKYKMCVDERECILCGTCIDTCIHDVRHYRDDCDDFLVDLKNNKPFSVLIAPAFYLNYPEEYKHILGYLKSLGAKNFYSVSFGADITTWGYIKYINSISSTPGKTAMGNIAQPCPSIVRYIEKQRPELLPNLVPIQSPMLCTAIYLKKYKKVEEDLVFLGPCVAKKAEIESKRGKGLIRYNVTFKSLMEHIRREQINLNDYPGVEIQEESGMGSLLPKPGGLKESLEYYLEYEASIIQVEGEQMSYNYLDFFDKRDKTKEMPVLVDALNCRMGCIYGTGTEFRVGHDYEVFNKSVLMRKKKYSDMKEARTKFPAATRLEMLNETFKDLDIEDFKCEYEDKSKSFGRMVTDLEIEVILKGKLMKLSDNDQHVDCSACGYETCREMAEAIALGINHHDNCVYYVKNSLAVSLKEGIAKEERLRVALEKNQENTRSMRQRLLAIINSAPILCALFDRNFNITDVNEEAAKLLNLADKQEYVDRFFDLCPDYQPDGMSSRKKSFEAVQQALRTGSAYISEWVHTTYDGSIVPVEVYLERVGLGGEDVVIVYARDLRDQKRMLSDLEYAVNREQEANKAKSRFLSNMSHEIRTPMNSVLGIAELQIQKDTHSPETEEAFWRIYSSSNLLLSIINDILDLSKVESGKMEILPNVYEVASMIIDTVQLNIMYIGSKRIEFKLNVDERIPSYLIGDELRIKQILNNLLSNAFKYTTEGTVSLSLSLEDGGEGDDVALIARVSDTGQGMTSDQINKLFNDEYIRFNVQRNIEGSGLGLVIAYRLVYIMGGDISVKSEQGKGSEFTVRLPQKKKDSDILGAETVASLQNLEDTQKSLKRIAKLNREPMPYGRVLVVDDVESNLYVAKGFLMPYKIAIDTADSGEVAVAKIKEGKEYDIIFMDHMMPDMDGVEATKIIRDMGYKEPIIALTANALRDAAEMFMSNGFTGYISKPIDVNKFDKHLMRFIYEKQPQEIIDKARMAKIEMTKNEDDSGEILSDELMESFLRDAKKALEVLDAVVKRQAYDENDLRAYIIQVHAMKSAFLNIKQPKLSKMAATLESAAREADIQFIKTYTTGFVEDLQKTAKKFDKIKNGSDVLYDDILDESDIKFLRSQMNIIWNACDEYDIDSARSSVKALDQKTFPKKTKQLISEIADNLLNGDLEEASNLAKKASII